MDEQSLQELVERLRLVGTDQQQVEVKSAVGKSVLETLSAFSNGAGGIVLIGLAEREGFSRRGPRGPWFSMPGRRTKR